MSLIHSPDTRNAICAAVATAVDTGAGTPALEILEGTTVLATILLDSSQAFLAPATGGAGAGQMFYNGLPREDSDADANGTANAFRVKDADGGVRFSGTVTAVGGGGDLELSSVGIVAGDAVRINTGSGWQAPA